MSPLSSATPGRLLHCPNEELLARDSIGMVMTRLFLAAALATASGCQTAAGPVPGPCPIVSSSDWQAWVNAMPGPGSRPKLIATGKVVVPTGGYAFRWGEPRVMESYPVQVAVELIPIPPAGPATQALETREVRGEWPMSPPVGSFTVTCGGKALARISPVETAH
jgi:hypothetical protein